MKHFGLGALLVLGCWLTQAPAQVELPPAAQEVLKQFEDESAEVEKRLEGELKAFQEKTAVALKKVQDELCKEGKLDDAVAVRDAIRRLEAGNDPPLAGMAREWTWIDVLRVFLTGGKALTPGEDLPAPAREVYREHRKGMDGLLQKAEADLQKGRERVLKELTKVQEHYSKQAKLDEALAVRDLARQVKAGVINALPDPGYVNNPATDIGKVFYYEVTGVETGGSTYGTDVYTTGSHLGMTAVHRGILRAGQRGIVKVTILPGQANYVASVRNGVTSHGYGQWSVSFKVDRVYGLPRKVSAGVLPDPGTLTGQRANVGQALLFEVTGSNAGSAWGTDTYTDDSTLAVAAVHAGVLGVGQKGVVKVTILAGQESYAATTRNGVTTGSWGAWTGSFRVEAARR